LGNKGQVLGKVRRGKVWPTRGLPLN